MLEYKIKCPFCGNILDEGNHKPFYSGRMYQCNGKKCLPDKAVVCYTPAESFVSISVKDYEAIKDEIEFKVITEKKSCKVILGIAEELILEKQSPPKVTVPKKIETKINKPIIKEPIKKEVKPNGDN